jgi:hypothetical protein
MVNGEHGRPIITQRATGSPSRENYARLTPALSCGAGARMRARRPRQRLRYNRGRREAPSAPAPCSTTPNSPSLRNSSSVGSLTSLGQPCASDRSVARRSVAPLMITGNAPPMFRTRERAPRADTAVARVRRRHPFIAPLGLSNTGAELRRRRANAREAAASTPPLQSRPPRGAVCSSASFDNPRFTKPPRQFVRWLVHFSWTTSR